MKNLIKLSDFSFQFSGHGHYIVTYTSPLTRKSWKSTTSNMPLIDATKNAEYVKKVDMEELKRVCKKA